jgi:hypothetical protein
LNLTGLINLSMSVTWCRLQKRQDSIFGILPVFIYWVWVLCYDRRSVGLGIKHPFGDYDQIFITVKTVAGLMIWVALSDRTDVICNWSSPAQSFSSLSPSGLATIFYCLRFESFLFVASYDLQSDGGVIWPHLHMGVTFYSYTGKESTIYTELVLFWGFAQTPKNETGILLIGGKFWMNNMGFITQHTKITSNPSQLTPDSWHHNYRYCKQGVHLP